MSLVKWKNRNDLLPTLTMPNWVENFFKDDDFFDHRWFNREMTIPAVNVSELKDVFQLEVAVPGMKKEDFKIELKDGMLSISAENKMEKEQKEDNYTRREFSYNSFCRTFWLPENVKLEDIKANYTEGILRIEVPKVKTEKEVPAKTVAIS